MNEYYKSLWLIFSGICLFKKGPQDIVYSRYLMQFTLALYIAFGALLLSIDRPVELAIMQSMLEVGLLSFFIYILVYFFTVPSRFPQTIIALYGCGIIISCLSFPVIYWISATPEQQSIGVEGVLLLALVVWSFFIMAYIVSKAIDKVMSVCLLISFSYFYLSYQVVNLLLPVVK